MPLIPNNWDKIMTHYAPFHYWQESCSSECINKFAPSHIRKTSQNFNLLLVAILTYMQNERWNRHKMEPKVLITFNNPQEIHSLWFHNVLHYLFIFHFFIFSHTTFATTYNCSSQVLLSAFYMLAKRLHQHPKSQSYIAFKDVREHLAASFTPINPI